MANELEARVLRKVTWRIIPFVMLLYFVAFIDRVNIGFAALTMNKDIGLSPAVFGFGAGIFFFGYFLFEVPSNIILDRVGARIWIARVMITWGLVSARHGIRQRRDELLCAAFPARRGGGGLLPRHHPLSDLLVSGARARGGYSAVHGGPGRYRQFSARQCPAPCWR